MNLFNALETPPELRDAIEQTRSAIQQRADADLAVAVNAQSIEAATVTILELEGIAARLHAESIKCEALASANAASKTDLSKAVKAADKAAIDLAEKKRALERSTAARPVLVDMARDADATIALAKASLTSALAAYREQLLSGLEDDLREACNGSVSFRNALAAARTVDAEFPGGLCTPLLDNLKIISPRTYRISHDEIGRPRVSGTDLLAEEVVTVTLPEQAALALRDINEIVNALKRHKPFTMAKLSTHVTSATPPRSAAEQKRYDEAAERIRQSEQEYDERERRSKLPQNEEQQRKWTLVVRYPGTPVGSNPLLADLDGNVSDEWRRTGMLPPESADQRNR